MIILCMTLPFSAIANQNVQVCFTPGQDCVKMLANTIKEAKKSIYVQAYTFTSYQLADALISAHKRGVAVNIIFDRGQFAPNFRSAKKVNEMLQASHLNMWKDSVSGLAHNKVMIIDKDIVETGSFNFTYSAQKFNAENMLIIADSQLAQIYMKNWIARKNQSIELNQ